MAGRIKAEDIALLRERVRLDEVVSDYVALKPAGVDSLKGLCPFHDEKTPSFNVRPSVGLWHCFGCGEGGDAISFVERINHMDFVDAVEFLAQKFGVQLHYEDTGNGGERETFNRSLRQRILEANLLAEKFYQDCLAQPAAAQARYFLGSKGFGPNQVAYFGIGYAPAEWGELARYLRGRGFNEHELTAAGLCMRGKNGNLYDRFRNRVIWPIRDVTGATVGFGARRLGDDDGPKYLNTPETEVYKKARVLYGLDLAKREIVKQRRVVIVEGYTDVMAAHLAGITTAVATCGTAFGSEHTRLIRRLLGDTADPAAGVILSDGRTRGGEVIFTFDGDAAGQKAALHAFQEDQEFAMQTFVAVAKDGLDPCDLRLEEGDDALRELIESRVPLFEFVLRTILKNQDLSRPEGRVNALHAAAPIVGRIRDHALRGEYARRLAGWLGMEERDVYREIRNAQRFRPRSAGYGAPGRGGPGAGGSVAGADPAAEAGPEAGAFQVAALPPVQDIVQRGEREALAVLLQYPQLAIGTAADLLTAQAFTLPLHQVVWQAIAAAGGIKEFASLLAGAGSDAHGVQRATQAWLQEVRSCAGPELARVINALLVMPLPIALPGKTSGSITALGSVRPAAGNQSAPGNPAAKLSKEAERSIRAFAQGALASVVRVGLNRRSIELRAELERTPAGSERFGALGMELQQLEQTRRSLLES